MKKTSLTISDLTKKLNVDPIENQTITNWLSLGILFLAIVALACSPIFTKLSEIELSPTATIFNRLWIATIIVSFWQLIKVGEFQLIPLSNSDNRQIGLLILASFCATASAILWAVSFTQTSVASSTALRSLTPLFISFGAWLILKQTFERQFVIGLIIAVIGGIAIGWADLQLDSQHLLGDSIALLSAAIHGANILTIGRLRDRGCSTDRILLWRCGCGTSIMLPIVYFTDTPLLPISASGWLIIIALAFVCQVLGQGLLVYSLKQFSASFVGIFALLKPLIVALLAWIIFAEEISVTGAIALVLILTGIYLAKSSDSSTM